MKPKILLAILLLVCASLGATAQQRKTVPPLKSISLTETVTQLFIQDDIEVVLTDNPATEILVDGNAAALETRQADGQLLLSVRDGYSLNNLKVYVPARSLSKIFLNGNGLLRSASVLQGGKLRIYLAAEAKIQVRSVGSVTVEPVNDIRFVKAG